MTPEKLMQRVRIDPDTGCWIWLGYCFQKAPRVHLSTHSRPARKHVYEVFTGEVLPENCVTTCPCDDHRCVYWRHTEVKTRKEHMHAARKASAGSNALRTARMTATKRAKSKFSDALIADARAAMRTEDVAVVAGRFGLSVSYAYYLRRHKFRAAPGLASMVAQMQRAA